MILGNVLKMFSGFKKLFKRSTLLCRSGTRLRYRLGSVTLNET